MPHPVVLVVAAALALLLLLLVVALMLTWSCQRHVPGRVSAWD